MNPYALIPLIGCVLCAGYCLSVWKGPLTPEERVSRRFTRSLFLCFSLYAAGEAGLQLASDPAVGARFFRLGCVALVAIGPIAVWTTLRLSLRPHPVARQLAIGLVLAAAGLGIADLMLGGLVSGVTESRFGRLPDVGPLYFVSALYVVACGTYAYVTFAQSVDDTPRFEKAPNGRIVSVVLLALIVVASTTDVLMPLVGVAAPRLSSLGMGLLALSVVWSMMQIEGSSSLVATPSIISEHILHALNEGVAFVSVDDRVLLANESLGHMMGTAQALLVGIELAPHVSGVDLSSPVDRIDVECELRDLVGSTRPVSASISTVRDSRGQSLGRVVVIRDVRELKTLKSRLVTSGRLAAVGQMAAGIAHEINNPISFVRTNLGVLREHWALIETALQGTAQEPELSEVLKDGDELIGESIEGVDRAAGIVRDVRELSHVGDSGRASASLNPILERVIRLVSPEVGPGITIERRFDDRCRADVSKDQISQVFINLLTNAVHAVGGQGHIVLETRRVQDRVEVSVIDDGHGVPDEIRERIFDPFYTTKEVGEGTGLGLSISHEIVRNHAGDLSYQPNSDGGACFTVVLPASRAADAR